MQIIDTFIRELEYQRNKRRGIIRELLKEAIALPNWRFIDKWINMIKTTETINKAIVLRLCRLASKRSHVRVIIRCAIASLSANQIDRSIVDPVKLKAAEELYQLLDHKVHMRYVENFIIMFSNRTYEKFKKDIVNIWKSIKNVNWLELCYTTPLDEISDIQLKFEDIPIIPDMDDEREIQIEKLYRLRNTSSF
jgi:hypothetical protein